MNELACLRRQVDKAKGQLALAQESRKTEHEFYLEAIDGLAYTEEAQVVFQTVAQAVQQEAHARISAVVSRCLKGVFDDPYEFHIRFEQKRGRTEAVLVFVREDVTCDPMGATGGGVVDVAAFALRLACMALSRPRVRPLLVLDEPFKFVSAEYRPRVRVMLETLARDMEVQIVMVTHIPELETGTVLEVE